MREETIREWENWTEDDKKEKVDEGAKAQLKGVERANVKEEKEVKPEEERWSS